MDRFTSNLTHGVPMERFRKAKEELLGMVNHPGDCLKSLAPDFTGACLDCELTSFQRGLINLILVENSFDPKEVWTRFQRRIERLSPTVWLPRDRFSRPKDFPSVDCSRGDVHAHEFRLGGDFLHVLADICAEGDVRIDDLWVQPYTREYIASRS